MIATLTLDRTDKGNNCTFGILYLNNEIICHTLEDTDRKIDSTTPLWKIKALKIWGKTAIPSGHYDIKIEKSPRFKVKLPKLIDVPGFSGILIHTGNTINDTDGCILPGEYFKGDMIYNSRKAFNRLMAELNYYDDIKIKVLPLHNL